MSTLRRLFHLTWVKVWTLIVASGVLLGILSDFPFSTTELKNALHDALPIGEALLPWVVLAGALLSVGYLAGAIYLWVLDIRTLGPQRRDLIRLHPGILSYKELLTDLTRRARSDIPYELREDVLSDAKTRVEALARSLNQLGIPTPPVNIAIEGIHLVDYEGVRSWIRFLIPLALHAGGGDIRQARRVGETHANRPEGETPDA